MADITIGAYTYKSLTTIEFANEFLAADITRSAAWGALGDEEKGPALVSATRILLTRVPWIEVPDPDGVVPVAAQQATAMLAANLAANPSSATNLSGASNLKRAYAEGSGVEFFEAIRAEDLPPIPSDIWFLLVAAGLIGGASQDGNSGPYYSGGHDGTWFDLRTFDEGYHNG